MKEGKNMSNIITFGFIASIVLLLLAGTGWIADKTNITDKLLEYFMED
jgi:hypothetical protein